MREVLVVLLRTCRFFSIFFILLMVGCSKKSTNQREHIDAKPVSSSKYEGVRSGLEESLANLIGKGEYLEAFRFIFNKESFADEIFIKSDIILDEFQKIVDGISSKKETKDKAARILLDAANRDCKAKYSHCSIPYFLKLDNRLNSFLISQYDQIENQKEFLNYIFSSNYKGEDKWKLLTTIVLEGNENEVVTYRSVYLTALANKPDAFSKHKNADKLILKLFPKNRDSWFSYIKELDHLKVISPEVRQALINKGVNQGREVICAKYKVNILQVPKNLNINCGGELALEQQSMSFLLTQDLMLGLSPDHISRKDKIDIEQVTSFLFFRGFSLMEESLLELNKYVDQKIAKNEVPKDFIQRLQRRAATNISPRWSLYFEDISKAIEAMMVFTDDIRIRELRREFKNFFSVSFELPFNLMLSSKVLDIGHREILNFRGITLQIDAKTIANKLFSGRMDQMVKFFEDEERQYIDPLKVVWAFMSMKKFNTAKVFNSSIDVEFTEMFNQAVEDDYQKFSKFYEIYLRRRKKMPIFNSYCKKLKEKKYSFNLDLGEVTLTDPIRLATGYLRTDNQLDFMKRFQDTYLFEAKKYFVPEMFEMYRSEFYPKAIIRNSILGKNIKQHAFEKKIKELIASTEKDIKTFDACFADIRKVESDAASLVIKGESLFAKQVKIELDRLNNKEITESDLLDSFLSEVKKLGNWDEFFQDLPTKYGFQQDNGRFHFTDSPLLQALRIFSYIKRSHISKYYTFSYDSYHSVSGNIEEMGQISNNFLKYKGIQNPLPFFMGALSNNFKLLDERTGTIWSLMRLNNIQALIQKIDFKASKEKTFKRFEQVYNRSESYIKHFSLQAWEEEMLESVATECPSCGSFTDDKLAGPFAFLASYGPKETLGGYRYNYPWSPMDNYFQILGSFDLGLNAQMRQYLSLTNSFIVGKPPASTDGGPGGGVLDAEDFFKRENPWDAKERMMFSASEIYWDSLVDFGDGAFDQVARIIKFDIKLMKDLRDFSQEKSKEVSFGTYNFSRLHPPYTPDRMVSDDLWTSYDSDMKEFHRSTFGLYRVED